jgi:hypothetical protein
MANLIDSTYFKGDILLTNKTALSDDLTAAITRYEKEILISLLGYKLYSLLIATPTVEPYKSLIDGAEFELTFDGITQTVKWPGLANAEKESLIAYYVYCKYQEITSTRPTAISTAKPKAEAVEVVTPLYKITAAWNRMLEMYGFYPYMETIFIPVADDFYSSLPTAYNYMVANIADFPDWVYKPLKQINPFMI